MRSGWREAHIHRRDVALISVFPFAEDAGQAAMHQFKACHEVSESPNHCFVRGT